MTSHALVSLLVMSLIAAPAAALAALGLPALFGRSWSERTAASLVSGCLFASFAAGVVTLLVLMLRGFEPVVVHVGNWFSVGHHEASIDLVADALSIPYVCFSSGLCALVSRFSAKYVHRERGFMRFFMLMSLFGAGMNLLVLADSMDMMFVGWECVGLSSALLIGFFHDRETAVRSALRAFATYRVCDVGLLTASVIVHRLNGTGDFEALFTTNWPSAQCLLSHASAEVVALLLVFAALGKSAQVPFSGWLPRAMEGPTPSSAIFYGALSIHAGAYVLLRCESILDEAPVARAVLLVVGVVSALHASLVGRVQTDFKCMLAYASMAQASLILVEIALGWRVIPLIHVVSHAILRSLQILRSPSALHDRHELESALGGHPSVGEWSPGVGVPATWQRFWYRVALERGYEDMLVFRYVVRPIGRALEAANRAESAWSGWLARKLDRRADRGHA